MKQRPATRIERAALRRALDLARITLAYAECVKLALRGTSPEKLRREIKKMRALLEVKPRRRAAAR